MHWGPYHGNTQTRSYRCANRMYQARDCLAQHRWEVEKAMDDYLTASLITPAIAWTELANAVEPPKGVDKEEVELGFPTHLTPPPKPQPHKPKKDRLNCCKKARLGALCTCSSAFSSCSCGGLCACD